MAPSALAGGAAAAPSVPQFTARASSSFTPGPRTECSMADVDETKKKKAKPTSWQRRKAAKLGTAAAGPEVQLSKPKKQPTEAKAAELALRDACTHAKAASASARERYRLGQPAEPADDQLAAQYSKARAALNQFLLENGKRHEAEAAPGGAAVAPSQRKRKMSDESVQLEADGSQDIHEDGRPSAHPVEGEAAPAAAPEATHSAGGRNKRQQRVAAAAAAAAEGGQGEQWTCALCDVTILVRQDGRAREQHLAGKAHTKRAAAAALVRATAAPAVAGDGRQMYTCKLCACTLALGAGESHEAGARHRDRAAQLALFLAAHADGTAATDTEPLKRGDWVCCVNHAPQLVYASRGVCCRARCGATREQGLSQQEAARIAAGAAPQPPTPGGRGRGGTTARQGKGGVKGRAARVRS